MADGDQTQPDNERTQPDQGPAQPEKKPGFLDLVTGKIGKISALIVAVGALLTGAEKVFKIFGGVDPKGPTEVVKLKDCFEADLTYPKEVSFNGWSSMSLRMSGANDCGETLIGHVAFKAPRATSLRILAPFAPEGGDCTLANPDCWESITFTSGPVDYRVSVPELKRLGALTRAVPIDINWIVYSDNKSILSGKARITVLADPAPPDGGTPSGR